MGASKPPEGGDKDRAESVAPPGALPTARAENDRFTPVARGPPPLSGLMKQLPHVHHLNSRTLSLQAVVMAPIESEPTKKRTGSKSPIMTCDEEGRNVSQNLERGRQI